MSNVSVSVVIPTYNAPALLAETLATVFAQTFTDFEAVIIDDGSTDETPQRLAEIAAHDPRVRVVRQTNGGIGAARNRGIDEARGTYVALLDHDDLWHSEKLADQVAFLRSRPECASVVSLWDTTAAPGVPTFRRDEVCDDRGIVQRPMRAMANGRQLMLTSAIMFVRERASGLRYATERRCIEDLPFQIKLLARGAIGVSGDEIRMTYRTHALNYSKQAAFYYNGMRLLRAMRHTGEFDEHQGAARTDLDAYLAATGRWATFMQISGGHRREALGLYAREFPFQLRQGRLRFLAAAPVLAASPASVIRRKFAGHETV